MCLRLLVRLEQSEEGERQGMQSEWHKRLLQKPGKGPRTWFTLTSERGWRGSTVHPFAAEESNSALGHSDFTTPPKEYTMAREDLGGMSLQCGYTLPWGFPWPRYKSILRSCFKTSLYERQWPHCSRSKVYKVAGVQ